MRILLTGGTGRLGQELKRHLEGLIAPSRSDLDLLSESSVSEVVQREKPELIVHAAAYTNVSGAEDAREICWATNVRGTRYLVAAASSQHIPLVHISTDYVFFGDRGMYKEDDVLGTVRNYYALTKLVAEELVRMHPNHLVIRTSFRPKEWPYPSAFADVYTSQDYVDVIAPEIALAIQHYDMISHDTLHIATERKSVYELAQRRKPDVKQGSKHDVSVDLPDDISLDIGRWEQVKGLINHYVCV